METWLRWLWVPCLFAAWSACQTAPREGPGASDAGSGGFPEGSAGAPGKAPSWLAYVSETTSRAHVVDVLAPEPVSLIDDATDLRWTPDGRWLLLELTAKQSALVDFSKPSPGPPVLLELAGTKAYGCSPSRTGRRLACLLDDGTATTRAALVELDAASPSVTQVGGATLAADATPLASWGPEDRWVIYIAITSGAYQLWVVDSTATNPSAVLLSSSAKGMAIFGTTSSLAYSELQPAPGLFVRDLAGGSSVLVAASAPSQGGFGWTTQGTALAYVGAAQELILHVPATQQSLVVSPGPVAGLLVSPDGTRLLYGVSGESEGRLLDTSLLPPKQIGKVPGSPVCWSDSSRFIATFAMPSLSLLDLAAPSSAPVTLSQAFAPSHCLFQGDLAVTWYSTLKGGGIGVALGPGWQPAELVAEPSPFTRGNFSWSADLERLAFRELGSRRLQVATGFPAPQVQKLTEDAVSAFAFRP